MTSLKTKPMIVYLLWGENFEMAEKGFGEVVV